MDNFMIAVVAMLTFSFAARIVNERAIKKLDNDQKVQLLDLFSGNRIVSGGFLLFIIVFYFASVRLEWLHPGLSFSLYILCFSVFILITAITSYKKLQHHNLPETYIKSYIISIILRLIGIVIFFALLKSYVTV